MKSIVRNFLLIPALVLTISGAKAGKHVTTSTGLDTASLNNTASSIILRGSLVNFGAAYGRNFFDLNWNTIAAQNCDHFEVERSLDGVHYEKVGEVRKNSDATSEENYAFRDNVKPAIARNNDLYYRLKQVDANGDFSYSKVLIARMYNTRALASLSVTPDPVVNDILVNVQLKTRSYVVIKVTDESGKEVLRKSIQANEELNTYKLDGTHELHAGMYSLEVIVNSNERLQMKLLKS
ncbi:MAG: hypothetical protein C5B59_00620 [Bacteroidetes bacterium]|nr:MAG: hypothetical protein C5B59_00620 [Bacteroidota bacterium]